MILLANDETAIKIKILARTSPHWLESSVLRILENTIKE